MYSRRDHQHPKYLTHHAPKKIPDLSHKQLHRNATLFAKSRVNQEVTEFSDTNLATLQLAVVGLITLGAIPFALKCHDTYVKAKNTVDNDQRSLIFKTK